MFHELFFKGSTKRRGGSIRKASGTLLDIRIACLAYLGMAILSWKQDNYYRVVDACLRTRTLELRGDIGYSLGTVIIIETNVSILS